jgi:hypothetical protein
MVYRRRRLVVLVGGLKGVQQGRTGIVNENVKFPICLFDGFSGLGYGLVRANVNLEDRDGALRGRVVPADLLGGAFAFGDGAGAEDDGVGVGEATRCLAASRPIPVLAPVMKMMPGAIPGRRVMIQSTSRF